MKKIKTALFLLGFLLWPLTAGAQIASIPASGTAITDLSIGYLGNIFGVVGGVLVGSGTQIVGQMFTIFNAGVLTLGGVVLMYVLIVGTLSTAHEGEFLSKKWGSVWIPLRSALGIAMIAPSNTGYSALQVFIMWIVVQGVNLANNIWSQALNYLNTGGVIISQNVPSTTVSNVMGLTGNVFQSMVCMYSLQNALVEQAAAQGTGTVPSLYASVVPFNLTPISSAPASGAPAPFVVNIPGNVPGYSNLNGICGSITITGSTQQVVLGKASAIQQMISNLSAYARMGVNNGLLPTPIPMALTLPQSFLMDSAMIYQGLAQSVFSQATNQSAQVLANSMTQIQKEGWISAGKYYYIISGIMRGAVSDPAPPTAIPPSINTLQAGLQNIFGSTYSLYGQPTVTLMQGSDLTNTIAQATNYANTTTGAYGSQTLAPCGGWGQPPCSCSAPTGYGGISSMTCIIYNYAAAVANPINPIVQIANLGATLLQSVIIILIATAAAILGAAIGVSLFGFAFAAGLAALAAIIGPFIGLYVMIAGTIGAIMAFYIPLIPYLIFVTTAIGWMIAVIESMVAAPIVALGIIIPEKHEVFGYAEPAILLVMNLFLRPALMIFGYIMGIILSYVAVWLLNNGLGFAVNNITHMAGAKYEDLAADLASLAVIIIYAVMVMVILNKTFGLIYNTPDRIMRWLGGYADQFGGGEGLEKVESAMSASGKAGAELQQAGSKGIEHIGSSGGGGGGAPPGGNVPPPG